MTEKRFTLSQNETFHTVRDNIENKPLGVFEFKDDEFPVYFCFHKIIDLLNNLNDENKQLKQFKEKVFKLIDDNIQIYEDTTTNDEFLQIQLDTKLQTLYNLRKELKG